MLDQRGVDRNAHDDQECLEAQRHEGADVVLSHPAPFLAHHRRHRDGSDGGDKVDLHHAPVHDNEDADGQGPCTDPDEEGLEPEAEQRSDLHGLQPCLKVRYHRIEIDPGPVQDHPGRARHHALRRVEDPHHDGPCIRDDHDGTGGFEDPPEDGP